MRVVAEQLHGHAISRRTGNDRERVSLVDSLLRGTVRRINDDHASRRRERGVHIAPLASNHRPEPGVKRLPGYQLSQADAVAAVESIPRCAQRAAQTGDLIAQFLRIDQILGAYRRADVEIVLFGDRHRRPREWHRRGNEAGGTVGRRDQGRSERRRREHDVA